MNDNTDNQVDRAAQAQDDHASMVESTVDRKIQSEMGCNHQPDFGSIAHSDAAVGDMTKECILDVSCRHCGRSGAFRVDLTTEIDW